MSFLSSLPLTLLKIDSAVDVDIDVDDDARPDETVSSGFAVLGDDTIVLKETDCFQNRTEIN